MSLMSKPHVDLNVWINDEKDKESKREREVKNVGKRNKVGESICGE